MEGLILPAIVVFAVMALLDWLIHREVDDDFNY
jgi:hypothetical protein